MNIGEVNDSTSDSTGQQLNFSGIQTLITPTSQYVFPPSVLSSSMLTQPTVTSAAVTATSCQVQEAQIQKYPPFIGQTVTSQSSSILHHMVNTNCRLAMISNITTPVASSPYLITGSVDATRKGIIIINDYTTTLL